MVLTLIIKHSTQHVHVPVKHHGFCNCVAQPPDFGHLERLKKMRSERGLLMPTFWRAHLVQTV